MPGCGVRPFTPTLSSLANVLLCLRPRCKSESLELAMLRRCWIRHLQRSRCSIAYAPEIPICLLASLPHEGKLEWSLKLGLYEANAFLLFEKFWAIYTLPFGHFLVYRALTTLVRNHWKRGRAEPRKLAACQYLVFIGKGSPSLDMKDEAMVVLPSYRRDYSRCSEMWFVPLIVRCATSTEVLEQLRSKSNAAGEEVAWLPEEPCGNPWLTALTSEEKGASQTD
ncbi:hypothetical protein NDU88_005374 [Pleurodeles waltl]|uniref:Uncharacterized protein n=1 Tax=Pleurodeles waltl TaxID=8319 RepID=A0AAV7WAI7_PLEWA|nr:hypothetical protein NDU88_005374 [Pleurodeles waltl]